MSIRFFNLYNQRIPEFPWAGTGPAAALIGADDRRRPRPYFCQAIIDPPAWGLPGHTDRRLPVPGRRHQAPLRVRLFCKKRINAL